jgi:hypothetical protein
VEVTLVEIRIARNAPDLPRLWNPEFPSLGVLGHPEKNTKVCASIELAPARSVWHPDMSQTAKNLGC